MSSLFLTHGPKGEVYELTGYQIPSCQIRWLQDNGVRHFIAADGYPRVVRSEIEQVKPQRVNRPNLSALDKVG